jgi:Helix-turn-helix
MVIAFPPKPLLEVGHIVKEARGKHYRYTCCRLILIGEGPVPPRPERITREKLAEVRKHRRVTQQDLAKARGVSQSRVSQIEWQSVDDTVVSALAAY